ncbi:MAG: hypothetical protein GOU99_00205 [Candidatus Altiarchaeota archaeon]|nr:hypothetical protein [Candidatus Altiarchaeota archaeon]
MNKWLVLVSMLLLTSYAYLDWEYLCEDYYENPERPFEILNASSFYHSCVGIVEVIAEPNFGGLKYLTAESSGWVAGEQKPLLPTISTSSPYFSFGTSYSFFIPAGATPDDSFVKARIAVNSSDGRELCSELGWTMSKLSCIELGATASFEYNSSSDLIFAEISSTPGASGLIGLTINGELIETKQFELATTSYEFESTNKYSSDQAKEIKLYLIMWTETDWFFQEYLLDFYDLSVSVSSTPLIEPESSGELSITVKNTGTRVDDYDLSLVGPTGWTLTITDVIGLEPDETDDVTASFEVPKEHLGDAELFMIIRADRGDYSITVPIKLNSKKEISLTGPIINQPKALFAFSNNTLDITVIPYGTINPTLFWTIWTEPGLKIDGGFGMKPVAASEISHIRDQFDLGGACAFIWEDNEGMIAARKVHNYAKLAYYISSENGSDTIEHLNELVDMIDAEKLKMTSDNSAKLYSISTRIANDLDRIAYYMELGASIDSIKSARESLYLDNYDMETELEDAADDMGEECSVVNKVELKFYISCAETLQSWETSLELPLSGPKVIDLIGPIELKLVSGESFEQTYWIKNGAGESYEVYISTDIDFAYSRGFIYVPAGIQKDFSITFRPPDYYETSNLEAHILLDAGPYSISFPIYLDIGKLDPQLSLSDEIAIEPGQTQVINATLDSGGLAETFVFETDAPYWVTVPDFVEITNKSKSFEIHVSPPSDVQEKVYELDMIITALNFPNIFTRVSSDIVVSTEGAILLNRLNSDESWLEEVEDSLTSSEFRTVQNYLSQANSAIRSGDYTRAKLYLNKAENALGNVPEADGFSLSWIAVIALLAAVGLFAYKKYGFKIPIPGQKKETDLPPGEI